MPPVPFVRTMLTCLVMLVSLCWLPSCATSEERPPPDVNRLALGILEVAAAVAPNTEARELIDAAQIALADGNLTEATRLLDLARDAWRRSDASPPATGPPGGP